MKRLQSSAAFTVAVMVSTLFSIAPTFAETITLVKPPVLTLTKIGGNIVVSPAVWSQNVTSKFSWVINGKTQRTLKGKSIPSPKKKGTVVQFSESYNGINTMSNVIEIGKVAVNGFAKISYKDSENKVLTLELPKTTPSNSKISYQWFSGPFEIRGEKNRDYTVATGDQGSEITLVIEFSSKGLSSSTVTSNAIGIPIVQRSYSLIWSDEFQQRSALNTSIWKPENGDGTEYKNRGWGNKERQYYSAEQIQFDAQNGLSIIASRNGAEKFKCYYGTQCEWLSAKYVTKGQVGFKYGRIEARAKGPIGSGSWAAVWMLGANIDERPWPGCGEIDIVELLGRDPKTVYGTPHGPASGQSYTTELENGFAGEFHNYAIDWLPDQITWYLDGKIYGTLNKSSLLDAEHTWVFDHEFYLILNLAMGGTFGGEIDKNVQNSQLNVRWVRYSTINGVGELIKH